MHDVRRHAFEQVLDVVVDDLVGDRLQFYVAEIFEDALLRVAVQKDEHVGGELAVEAAEQLGQVFAVHRVEDLCEFLLREFVQNRVQIFDAVFV